MTETTIPEATAAAIRSGVTPTELADIMAERGKTITADTIRYHCRDPRGTLYGIAVLVGGAWFIPPPAADEFAAAWERYGSLRRQE